jgi:hypothetical protein
MPKMIKIAMISPKGDFKSLDKLTLIPLVRCKDLRCAEKNFALALWWAGRHKFCLNPEKSKSAHRHASVLMHVDVAPWDFSEID